MVNLSGKTAFVTGASRGIGRASALALAQACKLSLHRKPSQESHHETLPRIGSFAQRLN
jgi:NAD(P)-dependent dehydrogenase (short-subunit alcohol dehydrogenase family)